MKYQIYMLANELEISCNFRTEVPVSHERHIFQIFRVGLDQRLIHTARKQYDKPWLIHISRDGGTSLVNMTSSSSELSSSLGTSDDSA